MDGISFASQGSALQSAGVAINRAVAGFTRDAAAVASASITSSGELLPALIDAKQQLLYTQAAAKMMQTADQMMGTLLDIRA